MTSRRYLRRITDLYDLGETVVLGEDEDGPILAFVRKLNSHERDEAYKDGQFAATLRRSTLSDESEEISTISGYLRNMSKDEVIASLIGPESGNEWTAARDDLHADPDWQARLILIDRGQLAEEGETLTEAEEEVLDQVSKEYLADLNSRHKDRMDQLRSNLEMETSEELEKAYHEAYRSMQAQDAFLSAHEATSLWFSFRACIATKSGNGWDHERCTHARALEKRGEVMELPDELINPIREALDKLNMTQAEAGNLDAPSAS